MPVTNFLHRNNKNNDNNASHVAPSTSTTTITDNGASKATAISAPPLMEKLPSEECRRQLRDRIVTSAATEYIRLSVDTSLELEEDADLSKEAKNQKRQEQLAAHEAYKDRLQAVLGPQSLWPVLSTCLLLDPNVPDATASASTSSSNFSVHETFACIVLLLCNYILLTVSNTTKDGDSSSNLAGYDARIRNVFRIACIDLLAKAFEKEDQDQNLRKKLEKKTKPRPQVVLEESPAEIVIDGMSEPIDALPAVTETADTTDIQDHQDEACSDEMTTTTTTIAIPTFDHLYRKYATRKFQAIEQNLAELIMIHVVQDSKKATSRETNHEDQGEKGGRFSRKSLVRAAKIGGVGIVAGTLFAVTGGLAAPGIAAGLAALGVGGTALAVASSHAALIALFGVGGGGLSAYKMKRRTDGLSEFTISHEQGGDDESTDMGKGDKETTIKAHLSTTVCISGWLRDEHDFQRPWGVTPRNLSRLERLQRFFSVVDPTQVEDASEMLKPYSTERGNVSTDKDDELWAAFSLALIEKYGKSPDHLLPLTDREISLSREEMLTLLETFGIIIQSDSLMKQHQQLSTTSSTMSSSSLLLSTHGTFRTSSFKPESNLEKTKYIVRVWDFQTEFGGDLYTLRWESATLLRMCQFTNNMVRDFASKAGKEVLKKTVLATLLTAVALPALLLGLAGSLDSDWTLIAIRSDLAGVELARSLLQSTERRPVNLIGFSFGARIIYSCLVELARHQDMWEEQQHERKNAKFKKTRKKTETDNIVYTREPASIVQDVILMGAPLVVSRSKLRRARYMVAGRFVNCYSRKDWILSLMFQYKNGSGILRGTCGTGPVEGVNGLENYDVASLVSSWHPNYCQVVPDVLDMVGFDQPMPTSIR